ncbi:acyl-CoA dehydrogenase family protein [Paenibacillus sp. N1-5-1-14]|uniref:acyl-CoA dehydrogenase family protein n=1 Tax=Paenibacillus radicibacter TaxID=2972488 RepID=UPI002158EF42|nr:acyl-CoA dehydrogenase family protein [Paenibacillus radicibacter]MCR8642042.1 acyl-CoA dehydrogenase family protein [Paenibacillus radicibacter]
MDFTLTSEQEAHRDQVRTFAQKEIIPYAIQIDRSDQFPRDIVDKMSEKGLLGLPVPKQWGGSEVDFLSYNLTIEEISYASATLGVILAVHTSVGTMPIVNNGTQVQKEKYLRKLATGQMIGAFALTEPQAGSDASQIATKAYREGENYILNGTKMFITNGGEADVYITSVVTETNSGARQISAFIVEKETPGLIIGKKEKKMGMNGSATTTLIFDQAKVPASQLLGVEGEGFHISLRHLDSGRISIAAQALGIARAAYDQALQYTKQQSADLNDAHLLFMKNKLASMATQLEAAKLLIYRAAMLRDQGLPCGKEASMAKMFTTDTAMSITRDVVQMLGDYGYSQDNLVERYMRDAKVTQIYEGTNQIQRIVIAKHILKDAMYQVR